MSLAAGAYIVVASDPDAFAFRYGSTILTSEYGTGGLSTISSITRSGTTALVTLNNTSNGFQDGEYIDIGGAAQGQYDGDFAIGNVTVNAGTTTFTYTVSGTPASPATPLSGQSLNASDAGYSGHFNNGGEEVTLTAPDGGVIEDFTYSNSWYPQTDGGGFSLVVVSTSQSLVLLSTSTGWEPSGTPNGTPGSANPVTNPATGSIIVNEVMSNNTALPGDMIEFYNTTSAAIPIGGWFVSNSSSNLMKYEIASGTSIGAYGYFVLTQDYNFDTLSDSGCKVPFVFNPDGNTVYLSSNYEGAVGGYQESQSIPVMPSGGVYGLYTKSDGGPNYPVASITLSGTTATVTLNNASNTLANGDSIYISGAAQSQYDGSFDIANVTVSSTAGTTTFTYTVTGSPTSPATALAGESITAAAGTTNFTLLETPEFGTLSGTKYSGAAQSVPYVSPLVTDEIMYNPSQPTAAETAAGYADNDFQYVEPLQSVEFPRRAQRLLRYGRDRLHLGLGPRRHPGQQLPGRRHHAQRHDGHGHDQQHQHRVPERPDHRHRRGRPKPVQRQLRHRQRQFRRRNDHLHLHRDRLSRVARHRHHDRRRGLPSSSLWNPGPPPPGRPPASLPTPTPSTPI